MQKLNVASIPHDPKTSGDMLSDAFSVAVHNYVILVDAKSYAGIKLSPVSHKLSAGQMWWPQNSQLIC